MLQLAFKCLTNPHCVTNTAKGNSHSGLESAFYCCWRRHFEQWVKAAQCFLPVLEVGSLVQLSLS